jgi:Flp pilus assembly protein TadD
MPATVTAPAPAPAPVTADPLEVPQELAAFVRRASFQATGNANKVQALLTAFFKPLEDGGLGMEYDNSYTRTLKEVWRDRKANCLGLTGLLVASCRIIDVPVQYAEPINTAHWRRSGDLIRFERHVVALVRIPPLDDVVADFLPRLQRRETRYIVNVLGEARIRALWAANRAAECLDTQDYAQAEAFAKKAVAQDATCGIGWNTLGVLRGIQSRDTEAETCYRQAIRVDPMDGTAVGNMEGLLRRTGRWDESVAFRRLGMELRRRDPYFQAFLANEAIDAGKPEEAHKHIRAAIKLQPQDPDLYLLEAQIRLRLGKSDEALQSLELARRWASPKERERYDSKLAALKLANS